MEYIVEYDDEANNDLINYIDYIERQTFSKEIAEKQASIIFVETMKLSFMPYMYPETYKDFHTFNIKNKKIFYKIYEDKKKVIIFRILSSFQEYENHL